MKQSPKQNDGLANPKTLMLVGEHNLLDPVDFGSGGVGKQSRISNSKYSTACFAYLTEIYNMGVFYKTL